MARTDTLPHYLEDIATAIKEKKGDDTPIVASDFDTEIANLPSGGEGNCVINAQPDYSTTSMTTTGFVELVNELPEIDLTVGSVYGVFSGLARCTKIKSVKTTTTYKQFNYMFNNCKKLESIDTSQLYSSHHTYNNMFGNCEKLEELNLSHLSFNGSATNINSMFDGCRSLKKLDISNLDLSLNPANRNYVFRNCGINNAEPTKIYVMNENSRQFILNLGSPTHRPDSWNESNIIIAGSEQDDRGE